MTAATPPIDYREELPSPEAFVELFRSTGWQTPLADERLASALPSSWHCVCAYADGRLVGMGRTLSDGVLHALIVEVIVLPEWQGRGVGTGVMRRLIAHCRAAGIDQIQLFAASGKRPFYEGLGFRGRLEDAPGMELPESP